jgi:hypothetical protein
MRQPQWDMEVVPSKSPIQVLDFFLNPVGKNTAFLFRGDRYTKMRADTSLTLSRTLVSPIQFQLFGVGLYYGDEAGAPEIAAIKDGLFELLCFNERTYLSVPVRAIPFSLTFRSAWEHTAERKPEEMTEDRKGDLPKEVKERYEALKKAVLAQEKDGKLSKFIGDDPLVLSPEDAYPRPLHIGKLSLLFKPGETFGARITWDKGVKLAKDVRLWVCLEGITYQPL